MDRDFEITTGPDGLPTQTFNGKTYKLWPNNRYFTRRQSTVKLKHLEQGEKWEEKVYDIEVEDVHEYFANGVLVHNCDALRYAMFQYHLKIKKKGGSSFGFEFINF